VNLGALGVGYLAAGAAISVVRAILRGRPSIGDAVLLLALWPMYAPFAFARIVDPTRETELLGALARARSSPLTGVLPDADSVRILGARLREAGCRLAELDALLARPDFDPVTVERRAEELATRGATGAAATAQLRVRTLGQLHDLRERYRSELDEVGELIAQLVTQAELVRLQPAAAHSSGELVRELVARVEGLGELFVYQATLEAGGPEYQPGGGRS